VYLLDELEVLWNILYVYIYIYIYVYIYIYNFSVESSSSYGSTAQFGPWPPLMLFHNNNLFTGLVFSPAPYPQPGGPGLHMYDPQRQGGPAIPPGTRYPF
jgi:hypothetical protein